MEATNIWAVELLQNIDLSLKVLHRGSRAVTVVVSAGAGAAAIIFVAIVVVQRAELLCADGLDGPPLAHVACHCLHHCCENMLCPSSCAMPYLASMLVSSFSTRLPVDELVVFIQLLLLHWQAKHDLIPIAQDARFSFGDVRIIDLHT